MDHDGAAVDPGLLRRRGRRHGHLRQPLLAGQLGRPGVRHQPLPRQPDVDGRVDPRHRRRGRGHRLRAHRSAPVDDPVGPAGPRGRRSCGAPGTSTSSTTPSSAGRASGWPPSAPTWSTRRSSTARSTAWPAPSGARARCCAGPRPDTSATTLLGIMFGAVVVLGLHAHQAVVGLMSAVTFPYLTTLVLLPAVGAAVVAARAQAGRGHLVPRGASASLVTVLDPGRGRRRARGTSRPASAATRW